MNHPRPSQQTTACRNQVYTLALEVPPPNISIVLLSNRAAIAHRRAYADFVENTPRLADLTDDELRALLNDDSLPLPQQIKVLDERRHRAAVRHRAQEMAELVATVPVMAALDESAEMVHKAQAWLDRAKWVRAKAVQSAVAAGYSLRTVAEVARVAPSTVMRLSAQELLAEPPPAGPSPAHQ